ncbi:hypothetical protein [Phascolarctobacterium succinatutens]|uniref:hypothetical protein n=1 Tax=Phascolarctobacterium succinatutens TaxID=626940 RepID=UPI003F807E80
MLRLYYPSIDGIPSDPEAACHNAAAGKNDIESDTINVTGSFITYADTCPDDGEEYGPEGSVIWGPRTIEENIYINGKWYINENSEEWEENEGC